MFEEVCERNLEGIVPKRKKSIYAEHGWIKSKNQQYMQAEGRHEAASKAASRVRVGHKPATNCTVTALLNLRLRPVKLIPIPIRGALQRWLSPSEVTHGQMVS